MRRAFEHRDRLTERERYLTIGTYYSAIGNTEQAIAAYRALLDSYPTDARALNNLGLLYEEHRDYARAEGIFRCAVEADSSGGIAFTNLVNVQATLGRFADAEITLAQYPLSTITSLDRPYLDLAEVYALAGNPDRAKALIADYEAAVQPALRRVDEPQHHMLLGTLWLNAIPGTPSRNSGLRTKGCVVSALFQALAAPTTSQANPIPRSRSTSDTSQPHGPSGSKLIGRISRARTNAWENCTRRAEIAHAPRFTTDGSSHSGRTQTRSCAHS